MGGESPIIPSLFPSFLAGQSGLTATAKLIIWGIFFSKYFFRDLHVGDGDCSIMPVNNDARLMSTFKTATET